jgi:hypothetical protein
MMTLRDWWHPGIAAAAKRARTIMSRAGLLCGFVLGLVGRRVAGSRAGKYWLSELSNHKSFQPLYNIMANRVPTSLSLLQEAGFAPEFVVDIGAHNGDWTKMALPRFPDARFIMIEAQPDKEYELKQVQAVDPPRIRYESASLALKIKKVLISFFSDWALRSMPRIPHSPASASACPCSRSTLCWCGMARWVRAF